MQILTRPTHQQVRDWMQSRIKAVVPPPAPEETRRELGWGLIEQVDEKECPR